jgi:hypothetical protein
MYSLALIIFVVSQKKAFEHFPIGSNVMSCDGGHFGVQMPSSQKLQILLKPNCTWMFIGWSSTNCTFMIPGQFGFNYLSGFREEAFWNLFPIGSNAKLSPVVAAILNPGMIIGRFSTKYVFFMPIGNPRWLPPQVIVLTQDHMGKIQKYILLWSYCTDWT